MLRRASLVGDTPRELVHAVTGRSQCGAGLHGERTAGSSDVSWTALPSASCPVPDFHQRLLTGVIVAMCPTALLTAQQRAAGLKSQHASVSESSRTLVLQEVTKHQVSSSFKMGDKDRSGQTSSLRKH
ncbi:hypothetical protein H8959_016793 [Pygathrix nigripes]